MALNPNAEITNLGAAMVANTAFVPLAVQAGIIPTIKSLVGFATDEYSLVVLLKQSLWDDNQPLSLAINTGTLRAILKYMALIGESVVIVDGILGRKFGDNFQYTLKLMIQYLESTNAKPSNLVMEIHTEEGERVDFLEQRLSEWCKSIQYKVHRHRKVDHERYLFTDQFGLQLGIGMDLLDKNTMENRGTDFSYARLSKLKELIIS
jgi:hypothetical protein